jgi:hypothetical protein
MTLRLLTLPLRTAVATTRTATRLAGHTIGAVAGATRFLRPRAAAPPRDEGRPARSRPPAAKPPQAPEPTSASTAERAPLTAEPEPEPADTAEPEPADTAEPEPAVDITEPPPARSTELDLDAPPEPLEPAAKTIDDEPVLAAEFAEPGAEDGAGPQLTVEEPWEGYAAMTADEVIHRIETAEAAELAVVELYEQVHRQRATVVEAAERRLRAISGPAARQTG